MTSTPNDTATPDSVQHLNPETLHHNPAFSQAVAVSGAVRTVYIGGEKAGGASGGIIWKGGISAPTQQGLLNPQAGLAAGGGPPGGGVQKETYPVPGGP